MRASECKTAGLAPDVFGRLKTRGIGVPEYTEIKRILLFEQPQALTYFEIHFPGQSPYGVLRQIRNWEKILAKDHVLFPEQRETLEQALSGAKTFAWRALVEMVFPRIASWHLSAFLGNAVGSESGKPRTENEIEAVNDSTGERRRTVLRSEIVATRGLGAAWEQAFVELGLLEEVLKDTDRRRPLAPSKHPQARLLFTHILIPRLYEFMLPFYITQGHVTSNERVDTRTAFYPKALFEDIVAILQQEFPGEFDSTNPPLIKSVVQRHLARRSTETAKKRPNRQSSTS